MTLYVDYENGNDSDDGSTIALGKLTLFGASGAVQAASAGEKIFVRTDSSATNTESYGAAQTISFGAGTQANPIYIIGIKSAVSDSDVPLQNNDIAVRGTDNFPIVTTTSGDLDWTDATAGAIVTGMAWKPSTSNHFSGFSSFLDIFACEMVSSGNANVLRNQSGFGAKISIVDSEVNSTIATFGTTFVRTDVGGDFLKIYGGEFLTTDTDILNGDLFDGGCEVMGVDMSGVGDANNIRIGVAADAPLDIIGCSLPVHDAVYLTGGTHRPAHQTHNVVASTTKSSGQSHQAYELHSLKGSCVIETTAVRTDATGADDKADGNFSLALTPAVDETIEGGRTFSVKTPRLHGWVNGDGSTSKTFTIYIANSKTTTDIDRQQAFCDIFIPDPAGTSLLKFQTSLLLLSTTAIDDDTDSTWGSGGNSPQKFVFTEVPDYSGPVLGFVYYAERFAASPATLYVDPLIHITDT